MYPTSCRSHSKSSGFTLIELLLSISITALVGAMAYAGLDAAINASRRNDANVQRLQEINLALIIIARDLRQTQRRTIRDEQEEFQFAFFGSGTPDKAIALTRGGWQNPAGRERSTLQRVHYHFRDNKLIRESWTVLDRLPESKSFNATLLEGVESMAVKFLKPIFDANYMVGSEWVDEWLPQKDDVEPGHYDGRYSMITPLALDLELQLTDLGRVRRLFIVLPEMADDVRPFLAERYRLSGMQGS